MKSLEEKRSKMRHRVTVSRRITDENESGEVIQTWQVYCTRWAHVEQLNSAETVVGGKQTVSEVGYKVTLHRDTLTRGITTQMRVTWDGRTLNIGGKIDVGDERELMVELTCTERMDS